jgi:hypothetical protein
MASQKHRDAILRALAEKEVPMTTSPEKVLSIMGVENTRAIITFNNKDLPPDKARHNHAFYITVECLNAKVPRVLVDNGSALNVCPLKTATTLGIKERQLSPSSLTIRAYDNSSKSVMGNFEVACKTGPMNATMVFHVLNIPTSYNLLLGRAWMHPLGIVPSTLQQKLRLPWKDGIHTILGDGEISNDVWDLDNSPKDEDHRSFEFVQTLKWVEKKVKEEKATKVETTMVIKPKVAMLMEKMGYTPGMGLGKFGQGRTEMIKVHTQEAMCKYGSGYKEDLKITSKIRRRWMGASSKLANPFLIVVSSNLR